MRRLVLLAAILAALLTTACGSFPADPEGTLERVTGGRGPPWFISLSILSDGVKNLRSSILDLTDVRATTFDNKKPHPVIGQVEDYLRGLDWRLHDVVLVPVPKLPMPVGPN